jgi:hypothetical protein
MTSHQMAALLNLFGIKPESGAPILVLGNSVIKWSRSGYCWKVVAA